MTWDGIKADHSPVSDIPGQAEYVANVRLRKAGELQRRYGYLTTAIAKQSGPIRGIVSANTTRGNFLTFNVDGTIGGFAGGPGAGGAVDPIPVPPVGPKGKPPTIILQDPLCGAGFTHNGTYQLNHSIYGLVAFGIYEIFPGSYTVTENCCYRVSWRISITSTLVYTGALGHSNIVLYQSLNPSPGAEMCDAGNIFGGGTNIYSDPNFVIEADGYICQDSLGPFGPILLVADPAVDPGGDWNRYNWTADVEISVVNVLCNECSP